MIRRFTARTATLGWRKITASLRWLPVVAALQTIHATAYLGLVPSEHSSDANIIRRGSLTKAGTTWAELTRLSTVTARAGGRRGKASE
jgi:transposase